MEQPLRSILTHAPGVSAHPSAHKIAVPAVGASLFLAMVAAFGTAPDTDVESVSRERMVQSIAVAPAVAPESKEAAIFTREERIQRGDTVSSLFDRLFIDDREALEFMKGDPRSQAIFRQLGPGKPITAMVFPGGQLRRFIFPLNGDGDKAVILERRDGSLTSSVEALKLETRIEMKSAEIRHSLFGATDAAGIPDGIATQLAEVFSGEIDFHRDLRKGDRFAVVYESITHLGKEVRSGRILSAEFINDGKSHRAAWYSGNGGEGGYYGADGQSLRKAFLRSPLEFSRITSGFSTARFHPVLQRWRAHKGIDYGAPTGTRIRATGSGTVVFIGNRGGYGKVVVLRHQSKYTTLYGHLSRFGTGLKVGNRVSQGDTIGYVGATGLATGPHLHYEFQVDGIHRNPLAMTLPSVPPLSKSQLADFQSRTASSFARIARIKGDTLALVD